MATQEQKSAADLGEQAIALAEELGRIAGTIEGSAETWVNQQKLADQLTRVRDGATQMLEGLTGGIKKGRKASKAKGAKAVARTRQADPAHAPGKRRRKPAPTMRGVKKSDEKISKLRAAAEMRQRRKSFA
jgi:hypothetical protein